MYPEPDPVHLRTDCLRERQTGARLGHRTPMHQNRQSQRHCRGSQRYPLDLFLRVITVSLETMRIVRALPGLEIK